MLTCSIKVLLSLLALGSQSSRHNNNGKQQVKERQQQHDEEYAPHMRDKVASSIAKGERRAQERQAGRREMCGNCHRPPIQCVCSSLPDQRIRTATHILVLQHPAEFRRKTFSTVPLLPLVLEHFQVQVGHSFEPDQVEPIRAALARGQRPLLLFPGPDAISLDKEHEGEEASILSAELKRETASFIITEHALQNKSPEDQKQSTEKINLDDSDHNLLVLIDGTWTQARRMAKNSPLLLEACQQVQFTADSVSLYDSIREEPEAHCLSTLETCAQALMLIEPTPEIAASATHHLHKALKSLVKVQLQHTSKHNDNNSDGTSTVADPRFVSRADAATRRRKRRLEVEREYFGTTVEQDSSAMEDETPVAAENYLPINQEQQQQQQQQRPADIRMDLGNGVILRSLRIEDAQYLDEHWEKRSKKSLGLIRKQLQEAVCLGIECEPGVLCASILQYRNGALGMLFVDETMRRRGFGSALLREATRIVLEQGDSIDESGVVEAFIVDGNAASEALFQSQSWVRANPNEKRGTGKRRAPRKWIFVKE